MGGAQERGMSGGWSTGEGHVRWVEYGTGGQVDRVRERGVSGGWSIEGGVSSRQNVLKAFTFVSSCSPSK